MSHAPSPWKLVSSELFQQFMIVDATGLPVASPVTRMSQVDAHGWRKKKLTAKELWGDIATQQEQDTARLLAAAPELLHALLYVQATVESGQPLGMSQINDAIRKAKGDQ